MSSQLRNGLPANRALAERVQTILGNRALTLYQVSQQSAELYGRSSPYFIPHNLYYDLRSGAFRPNLHQVLALSRVSGYRAADWLRVFGYNLEDIPRLQILLPSKRTVVLDTSLTDPNEWVPWFGNRAHEIPTPSIAPLAQLLKAAPARRIGSLQASGTGYFLYAKVGREDALAFPDLVPGSIVRVNTDIQGRLGLQENTPGSNRVFLVEHGKGFCCCRIRVLADGVLALLDHGLSYARAELRCPQEARLLGVADLEFRPLLRSEEPHVPKDLAQRWQPLPISSCEDFGRLLQGTRARRNLSIREAAGISNIVAAILKDERYAISPSSLSDYEQRSTSPRDFHKLITLCSIYGLPFQSVADRIGVDIAGAGAESMPDRYLFRPDPAGNGAAAVVRSGFLEKLLEGGQDIPLFLRDTLAYFSGFANVSLDDFFWLGGNIDPLHPHLANGLVALVNRRRKTPLHFASKPPWQQPLYIVLRRDGTYLAASCGVENDKLVVHPYTRDFHRREEYRHRHDVEVIGQIVAIARGLP